MLGIRAHAHVRKRRIQLMSQIITIYIWFIEFQERLDGQLESRLKSHKSTYCLSRNRKSLMIIEIAMKRGKEPNEWLFICGIIVSKSLWRNGHWPCEYRNRCESNYKLKMKLCHRHSCGSVIRRKTDDSESPFAAFYTFTHTAQTRRPVKTQHALHVTWAMCEIRIHTPHRNVQPKGRCLTHTALFERVNASAKRWTDTRIRRYALFHGKCKRKVAKERRIFVDDLEFSLLTAGFYCTRNDNGNYSIESF